MAIGDLTHASDVSEDLFYVDTGMYDVEEYGAVYVIDDERPAIVDSGIGTNYEQILAAVEEAGIDPGDLEVIALTHVHLDHAGGAGFIAAETGAEVSVHEIGAPHVVDTERIWEGTKQAVGDQIAFYTEPEDVPESQVTTIEDGDAIDLGTHELRAHHAPGHAPHQVVFEAPTMDAVFTADAAGLYVPSVDAVHPTSPPPNFTLAQVLADVETIRSLAPDWLCYAHFGPARPEDRLAEYERTIEEWTRMVASAREEFESDEDVIEHFVETVGTPPIWGERKAKAEVALNVRGVLVAMDRDQL
jgi:glyoxylase-like metal-dependent hydrolase (beta-lactamase superfamily II)